MLVCECVCVFNVVLLYVTVVFVFANSMLRLLKVVVILVCL